MLDATVLSSGVELSQTNEDGNYQVTYYDVSRFYFHSNAALVFTALALTIWAQGRWLSHPLPKTLPFLFWSFHLTWTFKSYGLMLFVKTPRRYIDYPDYVDRLFALTRFSNLTMAFALFSLFALLLWALARKLWAVTAR